MKYLATLYVNNKLPKIKKIKEMAFSFIHPVGSEILPLQFSVEKEKIICIVFFLQIHTYKAFNIAYSYRSTMFASCRSYPSNRIL